MRLSPGRLRVGLAAIPYAESFRPTRFRQTRRHIRPRHSRSSSIILNRAAVRSLHVQKARPYGPPLSIASSFVASAESGALLESPISDGRATVGLIDRLAAKAGERAGITTNPEKLPGMYHILDFRAPGDPEGPLVV
jgi:hypothetical protein